MELRDCIVSLELFLYEFNEGLREAEVDPESADILALEYEKYERYDRLSDRLADAYKDAQKNSLNHPSYEELMRYLYQGNEKRSAKPLN